MKKPTFNDEQRRTIARRFRKNRNVLGLTIAEVAYKAGVDEKVVKNIERGNSVSPVSYKAVGPVVGLMFDELLEFVSMQDEIQDLIDDMLKTDFTSPNQHAQFTAQCNPFDADGFAALHQSGLTMSGIEFSLFDVLIGYKANLDRDYAEYLKEIGLEKDQRIYVHAFSAMYLILGSLDSLVRSEWRLTLMDQLMTQVCELWSAPHFTGQIG